MSNSKTPIRNDALVNIFKKLLCLIISIICISALSVSAYAADSSILFKIEDGILLSYIGADKNVVIPESVFEIADNVFENHTELQSIDFSDHVYYIGDNAFKGCSNLVQLKGTSEIVKVGEYAFSDTAWYKALDGDIKLLNDIVLGCDRNVSEIMVPSGISEIAPKAFYENSRITSVELPSSLRSIGNYAFYGCSSLENIVFPSKIDYIGTYAFDNTSWLSSLEDSFVSVNDILIKYKGSSSSPIIPDTITQIAGGAFAQNSKLETVTLPLNLYFIGDKAFYNSSIKNITLPEKLVYIGDGAFEGCALEDIVLPSYVKYIGQKVFYSCSKLTSVIWNSSSDIRYMAFANCTSLINAVISLDVMNIGEKAFKNCSMLEKAEMPGELSSVGENAFDGCDKLTLHIVPFGALYEYAVSYNIPFEMLLLKGDVNKDGRVSMLDVVIIQKHIASLVELNDAELALADADSNGDIQMLDVTYLQKKIVGLI